MIKKLQLSLLFVTALLLASNVYADLENLVPLDQIEDSQDTILWPLLPNESLADLAAKFYPKNVVMQSRFIRKTQQLNKQANLTANARNATLTTIIIPNLHSLSVTAGSIKRAPKMNNGPLRLSYNVDSTLEKAKSAFQNIPDRLLNEYQKLLARNQFLKEEIAKLNERLVFLQNKLGDLKLILDKTLTLPTKKSFKNLNSDESQAEKAVNKPIHQKVEVAIPTQAQAQAQFFDFTNKLLWVGILAVGFLLMLSSYLYKRYQEKKYLALVNAISKQNQATTFNIEPEEDYQGVQMASTTLSKDTVVEEHDSQSVLQEAKILVAQNTTEEAIEHLKWSIKANPKTAINVWLYLLELFRKENLKDDFEKLAFQMHQNFNVMTPLWEDRLLPMVVAQSLEEFPYIIKFLTDKWPNEKIINYLERLISDNRNGERSGFSKAVIEEILVLIVVLKARQYLK